MGLHMLSRRRRRRRTFAGAVLVIAVAAVGVLWWSRDDTPAAPVVPTVPVVNTRVDIGCIDEPGATQAAAKHWYSYDAAGSLALDGEIAASSRLGNFAKITLGAIAAAIGPYGTSAVRDVAPDTSFCPTDRVVQVKFADGTELSVTAWRSVAAASPQWIPSEVRFVAADDHTFVSQGAHVVSVLTVAPDGTSVAVTAYGVNAADAFQQASGPVTQSTTAHELGLIGATPAQLTSIADAVLAFSVAR